MKVFPLLAAFVCASSADGGSIPDRSPVATKSVMAWTETIKLQKSLYRLDRAATVMTVSTKVRDDLAATSALKTAPLPTLPTVEAPIASNFDRSAFLAHDQGIPGSGRPDVVGAFRMICTSGQINWDDPIIYPGQKGRSPHLHQWFGNLTGHYDSTYASLRADGESTCNSKLNRSAYWVPAMLNAAGKVIRPDYISLYYKRRPITDPECFRQAAKGCLALPFNFRAVAGYDMNREGSRQPENRNFHHRCISDGKPSIHREILTEAIADCGGSGQIASSIYFGDCWNGQLDSPDHRSHITGGSYGGWGYLKCPKTHPYLIPQLTQTVAYTIQKDDQEVYFSSDRMAGMPQKAPGTTFHADYMAAWDPPTQATWERLCLNGLLSCSGGQLGDGTTIKSPSPSTKFVRLAGAPAR